MNPDRGRRRARRPYSKSGLWSLKATVKLLGGRAIGRRTALGQALEAWSDALMGDLGGREALSTQQVALIDVAVKTTFMLDSVDVCILRQPSLINARKRSLLPVFRERASLASQFQGLMKDLGLERRARELPDLRTYLAEKSSRTSQDTPIPSGVGRRLQLGWRRRLRDPWRGKVGLRAMTAADLSLTVEEGGLNIVEALEDGQLFGALPAFRDLSSWKPWVAFLRAVYGLPMDALDLEFFRKHAGRGTPAPGGYREAVCIVGRQSGKSRVAALVAAFEAMMAAREPDRTEWYALLVAQDQRASLRTLLRYAVAPFEAIPILAVGHEPYC